MTTKKRNPTDSTMRNVRAAAKKDVDLERRVKSLEEKVVLLAQVLVDRVQLDLDALDAVNGRTTKKGRKRR